MDLHTCKICGVVVDFDVMKDAQNDKDRTKKGYKYEGDYSTTGFFCPCCNRWIYER